MIKRDIEDKLFKDIKPQKAVLIFGPRRVGKTVLLDQISKRYNGKVYYLNGEDLNTNELLSNRTILNYQQLFSGIDLLTIDEAQNIDEVGKVLKLIVDHVKNICVVATGSSSFDLINKAGEPLVGRSYQYKLFPFSINELSNNESKIESLQLLEERLIYGLYPEVIQIKDFNEKKKYLLDLVNSYLLKDILMIDGVKNSSKMRDLLRLIAYQMGSEVSLDELGKQLGLSRNTVEKYLDLLSKTFVIYKLPAFSRNKRKEISKSSKWYFIDNGIRNAILNDFTVFNMREDKGSLFENFLISERIKKMNNANINASYYFWRSYSGQEIDLIEETENKIESFEFKLGNKIPKKPTVFNHNYPDAEYNVINLTNYYDFIV